MREFFDNIPLDNQEISEEQLQKIKASVLSRVKEEKAMSKKSTIRMVTIAVAAATTAALSAMIASAEPASAPVATIEEASEKPGEAAFKEYIEKAKAEDEDTHKEALETVNGWEIVNGWTCGTGEASYKAYKEYKEKAKAEDEGTHNEVNEKVVDWTAVSGGSDYVSYVLVQPDDDPDVCYYYYKISDEQLEEMLNNGWTLFDENINVIHENEVPVTE